MPNLYSSLDVQLPIKFCLNFLKPFVVKSFWNSRYVFPFLFVLVDLIKNVGELSNILDLISIFVYTLRRCIN